MKLLAELKTINNYAMYKIV